MIDFFQSLISGTLTGGVYSLAAIGLSLVFGVMGISNFAHGSLMMLGMYIAYFSFTLIGVDPYVSILLVFPLMFLLGVLLQKTVINRVLTAPNQNQILLTIGISLIIENLVLLCFTSTPKVLHTGYETSSIDIADIVVSSPLLASFAITTIITALLCLFLLKTDTGTALRATAQNREAAQLMGINVKRMSMLAFGLGSALAGTAGALILPMYYATPSVGHSFLLKSFTICVLGSLGSVFGASVGGLLIGIIESMTSTYISTDWADAIVFVGFLLLLHLKPEGLFSKARM